MEYKFNEEIFKEGQRAFICIPFNVWEECGQKGSIPVSVTIEGITFECKLVPKGNGLYYIPVSKAVLEKFSVNKQLEVSFQLISGLSRINNNSPYSLERPIRKIDSINIVTPEKGGLCGQACVAMLSGVDIDEIINLMGRKSSMSKVLEALEYFGIAHSDKMIYNVKKDRDLPKCCIINTKGHLMILFDGKYYDPRVGILEEYDLSKITGFLEISI